MNRLRRRLAWVEDRDNGDYDRAESSALRWAIRLLEELGANDQRALIELREKVPLRDTGMFSTLEAMREAGVSFSQFCVTVGSPAHQLLELQRREENRIVRMVLATQRPWNEIKDEFTRLCTANSPDEAERLLIETSVGL